MYQLKIKAVSLAAEARLIKREEHREKVKLEKWKARAKAGRLKAAMNGTLFPVSFPDSYSKTVEGLHLHRVNDVRKETRNALLAYGFLRGLKYVEMENFAWTQPNWERVKKLAMRYAELDEEINQQVISQRFAEWQDEALSGVQARWCESIQPGSMRKSGGCRRFNSNTYNADWIQMQMKRNAS